MSDVNWTAHTRLRWVMRRDTDLTDDAPITEWPVLQQLWSNGYGRSEWRDVPSVALCECGAPLDAQERCPGGCHADPRYTLTDLGRAYRDAMQRGAKLNGGVKAGEGGE